MYKDATIRECSIPKDSQTSDLFLPIFIIYIFIILSLHLCNLRLVSFIFPVQTRPCIFGSKSAFRSSLRSFFKKHENGKRCFPDFLGDVNQDSRNDHHNLAKIHHFNQKDASSNPHNYL